MKTIRIKIPFPICTLKFKNHIVQIGSICNLYNCFSQDIQIQFEVYHSIDTLKV